MKLDILMSCMHQTDTSIVAASHITGSAVVINQCDREEVREFDTAYGHVRFLSTLQRGLTKSRNMAIAESRADVCLLCDDDEIFVPGYEKKILRAFEELPQADVIIFRMVNYPCPFGGQVRRLKFPQTMHVASWQISFRRESLLRTGVRFDELLGAGSGNGAEEELKFLLDCQRAGLQIWYAPVDVASVAQEESTWFAGFNEKFFYDRGATTRYILGAPLATLYGIYYVVRKKAMYQDTITPAKALGAIFRGMADNQITKQARKRK
ncbi:MAG: glycosyltransferase [Oscillospiraceae bacterium]|nr:glycosyltransferase [Oscillospiraceae bacterium]